MTVKEFAEHLQSLPKSMQDLPILVDMDSTGPDGVPYASFARSIRPINAKVPVASFTERLETGVVITADADPFGNRSAEETIRVLTAERDRYLAGRAEAEKICKTSFDVRLNYAWTEKEERPFPFALPNRPKNRYNEAEVFVPDENNRRATVSEFVRMLYRDWEMHQGVSIHVVNQEHASRLAPYDRSYMPEDLCTSTNLEAVEALARFHPYLGHEICRVVKREITDYAPLISYYIFVYFHHQQVFPVPQGYLFTLDGRLIKDKEES